MKLVADTSVILDFLDGAIEDLYALSRPYRLILISPVVLHEVLRTYPTEVHRKLSSYLIPELLPIPSLEHWTESAKVLRVLYPKREQRNLARSQNDILIALSARDVAAPLWSRDSDFELICNHLKIGLFKE